MLQQTLINTQDSILIAIDIQDAFLNKLESSQKDALLERACWLIEVAKWLKIPRIITAEDIADLGSVHPDIEKCLDHDLIYDKLSFSLVAQNNIYKAVNTLNRKTCILMGLETDVCVAQSALDLMQSGYQVATISDATASPNTAHQTGLKRIHDAGGLIIPTKALYYEWVRTVPNAQKFRLERPHLRHPDSL